VTASSVAPPSIRWYGHTSSFCASFSSIWMRTAPVRAMALRKAPPACLPAPLLHVGCEGDLRVRVEITGPGKYENVGKSQPVLMMINPMIFTRTRTPHPPHAIILSVEHVRRSGACPPRRHAGTQRAQAAGGIDGCDLEPGGAGCGHGRDGRGWLGRYHLCDISIMIGNLD
jgi:hypothetical protein